MDIAGIYSLDATYYKTETTGCLAEWNCPIGRCYRTTNDDQRCVTALNGRDFFNKCYPDSIECLSTLFRPNALLIDRFVINSQNQPGTVTKPPHNEQGLFTTLPVSVTVAEGVLAAGKFFYLQGLAWVADKGESDPNARVLARFATRVTLRQPVVTEQPVVTTAHVVEVHHDNHHTMPIMPIMPTLKTQNTPAKYVHTNASLSWPHYSLGAITVVVLWTTYCWVN